MLTPLVFLTIGSLFSGYIFKETFIGLDSQNFWSSSIFFLEQIKQEKISAFLLFLTPTIVTLIIPVVYFLYIKDQNILENTKKINLPLYHFLLNKWYIDDIYDFIFVKPIKKIGTFFWKKGDEDTIDRFGPNGMSNLVKYLSNKTIRFQTGYIYDYAFVMLIGLSALITYLILT